MKIPSAKHSISYCKKLGYKLIRVDENQEIHWILEEKGIAVASWTNLLEMWLDLAREAAITLHEEQKFETFMAIYRCASSSQRIMMHAWAEQVRPGMLADPKMDAFLNLGRRPSVDELPRNWKDRLVNIRSRSAGSVMFPQRVQREIGKMCQLH